MDGDLPVLICGAGPTGLTLALELSRFGVPCRIIDRVCEPAPHSRALVVQPRTLELLEACRVTERILMFAQPIRHVELRAGEQTIVAVDLDGMPTPYAYVASVGQETLERTMIVCLHEQGVNVERGRTLTALHQSADAVEVELTGEGGIERLRCRYLAACDGADSTIRRLLDIPFAADAVPQRFALADVRLDTALPRDRLTVIRDADGGAFALVPLRDSWRAMFESPRDLSEPLTARDIQGLIDASRLAARVDAIEWSATYHVLRRHIARYCDGRSFFLGDAAHTHASIGGQGMNVGIADAVNLAWKLALVVNDGVDPRILATYHDERAALESIVLTAANDDNREHVAGLRVAYPHSPLSVNDVPIPRGLRAGMRVRGHRPGGYRPQPVVLPEGAAGAATTLVVRPDGYAGYVADGADAGGAHTYLRNVIGLS